jgi:uncharacterized protein DUF4386
MTRTTNSRVAGFVFFSYIACGVTELIVLAPASRGEGVAAKLASLAQHSGLAHLASIFSLIMMTNAFVLGVALYALTREYDPDVAMLALVFRVAEGLTGTANAVIRRILMRLATVTGSEAVTANVVAGALMGARGFNETFASTCFAIGSTLFAYLFLRARTIPIWLAWLGFLGSLLLAIGLPLQMLALIEGWITYAMWIPIAIFEVVFGIWLLVKGVAAQPAPAIPSEAM